jgi:hypothetical protein
MSIYADKLTSKYLQKQECSTIKNEKRNKKPSELAEKILLKSNCKIPLSESKIKFEIENPSSRKTKSYSSSSLKSSCKKAIGIASEKIIKRIPVSLAHKIRYSQLFVSPTTVCGKKIDELAHDILTNGWDTTKPPLRLVEMGDKLPTSLDNRRLAALQQIAKINPDIQFSIEKLPSHELADPLLTSAIMEYYKKMDPKDAEKAKNRVKVICKKEKIKPHTNGWVIVSRMNQIDSELTYYTYKKTESEILEKDPRGFTTPPLEKSSKLMNLFFISKRNQTRVYHKKADALS